MRDAKYVVLDYDSGFGKFETMFIFPNLVQHSAFIASMHRNSDSVVSAGFIGIDGMKIYTYGSSVSLGVKSRSEDTDLAQKMFNPEQYL